MKISSIPPPAISLLQQLALALTVFSSDSSAVLAPPMPIRMAAAVTAERPWPCAQGWAGSKQRRLSL